MSIYLDNSATSYPKPEVVHQAVGDFSRNVGVSSGRGAYQRALKADQIIYQTRSSLAQLFGIDDLTRIAFTFCATDSINLLLFGLLESGDHVIASAMEHNAVWRCLMALQRRGCIEVSTVPHDNSGNMLVEEIPEMVREDTRLIVSTSASNVTGTLMPVRKLGQIADDAGVLFLVDAAQTAGVLPMNVDESGIDMLAFTGHKGLLGPQGTGGFYVREGVNLRPVRYGGTGSESRLERQPDVLPDRFEAGTLNGPGLAGLGAGVDFILKQGVEQIFEKEKELLRHTLEKLSSLEKLTLYGPCDPDRQMAVLSFNIEGLRAEEVTYALDQKYGIMVRAGLHCSPMAHRVIGTIDRGAVRVSFGYFNTQEDVGTLTDALEEICRLL